LDLQKFGRVAWRFRVLVGAGLVVALAFAVLSLARVSFAGGPHLSYRKPTTWQSVTTLMVTQKTGGAAYRGTIPTIDNVPKIGDIDRFTTLAAVYSELANSDIVRAMALRGTDIRSGKLLAVQLVTPTGEGLPYINLAGLAASSKDAAEVARRGTLALRHYIAQQQTDLQIPSADRVALQITSEPQPATVAVGQKKTLPIAVFLGTMILVLGLAFVLENLRPAVRPARVTGMQPRLEAERRTA
jgi:hypothetical protein